MRLATPRVIIPVFPGTNCEYDTARAFRRAGGDPHILVLKNLSPADVAESCEALVRELDKAQILMLPGGFSGGDEPDGSAKFIASFFRNPAVADAVNRLLNQRDGLALGICNGFQALIKLGLVPYGEIRPITEEDPTLTFNTIHRHQSMLVRTRVASNKSPWLSRCDKAAEPADRKWSGRNAVCGPDLPPDDGHALQPERLCAGHRGHHQPGRPRLWQDGPLGAQRRVPVQERDWRQVPADL